MTKPILWPSQLSAFVYCQQSFKFRYVDKWIAPMTCEMDEGKRVHEELYDDFLAKPRVERDVSVPPPDGEVYQGCESYLRVEFDNFIIVGKMDDVLFTKDEIIIHDNKKTPAWYPNVRIQMIAYGMIAKEKLANGRDIFLVVGDVTREFTHDDEVEFFKVVNAVLDVYKKNKLALPNGSVKQCACCHYHDSCPKF